MNTQYTPGKWYSRPTGSGQHMVASEETGQTIAVIYNDNEANARLIAAAPDMFLALQKLLQCPDLNLDSLEDETIKALKDSQKVLNEI